MDLLIKIGMLVAFFGIMIAVGIYCRKKATDVDGYTVNYTYNSGMEDWQPYRVLSVNETDGSQTGEEGCLSVPGKSGVVTRPNYVKVKALDENMEEVIYEGTELLARAFCHEIDHLHGIVYVSKAEGGIHDVVREEE